MKTCLRQTVEQFTNAELRQRVRHQVGFGLLTLREARAWRMMAYGVLHERTRSRCDRVGSVIERKTDGRLRGKGFSL